MSLIHSSLEAVKITLISSDKQEIVIDKESANVSDVLRAMLKNNMQEGQTKKIQVPYPTKVLQPFIETLDHIKKISPEKRKDPTIPSNLARYILYDCNLIKDGNCYDILYWLCKLSDRYQVPLLTQACIICFSDLSMSSIKNQEEKSFLENMIASFPEHIQKAISADKLHTMEMEFP